MSPLADQRGRNIGFGVCLDGIGVFKISHELQKYFYHRFFSFHLQMTLDICCPNLLLFPLCGDYLHVTACNYCPQKSKTCNFAALKAIIYVAQYVY